MFIALLKALKFLDENSVPTQRYFDFLDDTQSARVLADGIRDAYEDLFRINKRAYTMSAVEIQGKLKSLTEGKKSETVIGNMTKTFLALSNLADFTEVKATHEHPKPHTPVTEDKAVKKHEEGANAQAKPTSSLEVETPRPSVTNGRLIDAITYRIEIILPPVRDKAVYDAIFRSLKEHLL